MKRFTFIAVIFGAALLFSGMLAPIGRATASSKESAVVVFEQKVKLQNIFLKGEYLFVHDEEKMARGEDCTYIYNHRSGRPGELVTSFHCVPVQRETAARFTVVTTRLLPDLFELREYQFAGSTEAHQVPVH
jgi:hypothetical protein